VAVCGQKADAARTALRPFGAMRGDNTILYYTHSGQSGYNSLQALFQSRFHRNSTLQVAYTWSKLISDTQLIDSPGNNVDFYNPGANRGPDLLNRGQILSANFIYNLPTLQAQNGLIRNAFGSWEMSSIISVASGPNVTPFISSASGGGDFSGTGNGGNENPMRVAGQPCHVNGSDARQWLNPNAYTMNGFQIGKLGSSGFGICTGPGNANVDFSLRKNFKLTERIHMQFQMDFFNLFNHPQYRADSLGLGLNFVAPAQFDANSLGLGNPATAEFLDAQGNPIFEPMGADLNKDHTILKPGPGGSVYNGFTGCGANHLASSTGTIPQTFCAASIVNTTVTPNQSFGLATQSRENGFRQIQYGLKLTF